MPRAPFPWFGGKRRVADVVWRAFGPDVPNYIEPFAGSLAVLLCRPGGAGKIETVNDRDRMLANFWRAVSADPIAVARSADWPVNEADLHARHKSLVAQLVDGAEFIEKMHTDPRFYDAEIAGWWVWGLCQWIGSGWCVEPNNHKHPKLDGIGKGVHAEGGHRNVRARQRPSLHEGMGVHSDAAFEPKRQLPDLAVTTQNGIATGRGVHGGRARYGRGSEAHMRKRPVLDGTALGRGVHSEGAHLPALGNDRGINGVSAIPCAEWFLELQTRLRRVRVACGDWKRVLGPSVLGKGKNVGGRRPCAVFLDPPYDPELRARNLYAEDAPSISAEVRAWALEHGDDPDLRIALCGYEGEHEMPASWTCHAWKAARGYAGGDNENRERERIWFSPHCLMAEAQQSLFDGMEAAS